MQIKKTKTVLIVLYIIVFMIGIICLGFIWTTGMKSMEKQAIVYATTVQSGIDNVDVLNLAANEDDIKKYEYNVIKKKLAKFIRLYPDVESTYLYTKRNGKIIFLVDSESAASEYYSAPGDEYTEAAPVFYDAMKYNSPAITDQVEDRWGKWICVLVPIKDEHSGEIIAVLGMDYKASIWGVNILKRTIFSGVLVLLIWAIFGVYSLVLIKNDALKKGNKKLEKLYNELGEKEELFRTIYEQSPFGISFGTANNKLDSSNEMYGKIVGRTKEELAEVIWSDITYPDDIELDNINFLKHGIKGEVYSLKKRYLRPDHTIVWTNMTIAPLKIKSKGDLKYLCMIEDISEQIKAEQKLLESERSKAMLLSNLPGMAYRCTYDINMMIQYVSDGCYDLTGYRPENFEGKSDISFFDLIHTLFREEIWSKWSELLEGDGSYQYEYPITTADGETKWVYDHGQPIYNEKGQIEAIEGLVVDISFRKKREDELSFLNYHDALTGLYNRRYFEKAKEIYDNEQYFPLSVIMGDINGLKMINDTLGHGEGDKLIVSIADILLKCCRDSDILARTGGDEFSILMPNTKIEQANLIIKEVETVCSKYKITEMDEAYRISISLGCATKVTNETKLESIIKDAEDAMYLHKILQTRSLHSSILNSIKSTLSEKSQETEEHAQRLIELSYRIGVKMNLMDKDLNDLELLANLHDIGKIGVSDSILNKPDKLTKDEWIEMKKHPEIGYRIAMSSKELAPIAEYILFHHERWDGTGYPQGLKGEEIPLLSRIIAIADSYDAMIEDRPYRKAMTKEDALREININKGLQFDPSIVEIFLKEIVTHI
ncbi:MAG: HD domain-containing phosphohydrolase [Mobilitalea sp.]